MKLGASGSKKDKKRAVVAVARKAGRPPARLWQSQATYDPLYNAKRTVSTSLAA